MARDKIRLASQRPQPCDDGIEQILMVTHREISATDRALKQHIADHCDTRWRVVEHNMAGGVAGAVIHIERQIADGHRIATASSDQTVRIWDATPRK